MKVTVTLAGENIFNLDVSEDLELENFCALLEFESRVPVSQMLLFHNGVQLQDMKKALNAYGVRDGDLILLQRRQPTPQQAGLGSIDWGSVRIPGQLGGEPAAPARPQASPQAAAAQGAQPDLDSPEAIRDMFLKDPHQLSLLKERNPELAEALLSGDIQKFADVLSKQRQERAEREMRRIRTINADIFDPDAQREIAEEIRMSNVNQNMEIAMEYSPESFGKVIMLYINCKLNGHQVKAFVDSGAQMTFMSAACAERCHIMRLVDQRWAGIAKGVGTQKIIGRVHVAQIQLENDFLPSSFSVLQDQPMDLVLGLDMLKRHQCCIDLKEGVLRIGTTGTQTPFLPEGELPPCARLAFEQSEEDGQVQQHEDRELAEALAKSAQESGRALTSQGKAASGATSMLSDTPVASTFPEASIRQITSNGFSREQAVRELRKANGDVNTALGALFAQSLSSAMNSKS